MLITASKPEIDTTPSAHVSTVIRRNDTPSIIIIFTLFLIQCLWANAVSKNFERIKPVKAPSKIPRIIDTGML